MNTRPEFSRAARSAKTRPLSGVLRHDGRQEIVVVTAHEKRLVINVEADISAIPISKVRRDEGLNLVRTDRKDWQIRFDSVPAPDSWVHDLALLSPPSPLQRAALLLLALIGALAALFWPAREHGAALASTLIPQTVTEGFCRAYFGGLGPQCHGGAVKVALAPQVLVTGWGRR